MRNATVLLAVAAAAAIGFAAARMTETPSAPSAPDRRRVDDELAAMTERLDRMERLLERATERRDVAARAPTRPLPAAGTATAPAPSADPYATWSDDEICLVAVRKGDDLTLYKAALARDLTDRQRAQVLVSLAAYWGKLSWHCSAEREALVEAYELVPLASEVGSEAAIALAYNYAATPDDRWRCSALFDAVLRTAPTEEQRMKGAYGLAWLHDLGDEPVTAAVAAYRAFLADWGEQWRKTPEVTWAQHRIALHLAGDN